MKAYLTDGWEIFDMAEMTPEELREANRTAQQHIAGNIYWTFVKPINA